MHLLSPSGLRLLDRRAFLYGTAGSMSSIALCKLLSEEGLMAAENDPIRPEVRSETPLAARPSHFPGRAKRVLMIFCSGAISQIDTFDYKPEIPRFHNKEMPGVGDIKLFQSIPGTVTKSPWEVKPRGDCGKYASDMLPHLAELVDEMCFIHSMTSRTNTHGPGENFMSTGFVLDGAPSIGSWTTYALGSENSNLPAFVAIADPRGVPQAGPNNWASGFLPAVFQGTPFNMQKTIPHLDRPNAFTGEADVASRALLQRLNERHLLRNPGDTQLAARIASYELAAKLQLSAPEVSDLSQESAAIHHFYGTDSHNKLKAGFARNCILARRLLERGVRFVQLFNGAYQSGGTGTANWDGHAKLKEQYDVHAPILDQPAAALLQDMKKCGLLEDTLVVFTTEFGRLPFYQKTTMMAENDFGRDHNPHAFTVWLAGAGVKTPFTYGQTDDFSFKVVENETTVYDLHATILHILGLNHERLTFKYNGIERRLTDVHGHVVKEVLS